MSLKSMMKPFEKEDQGVLIELSTIKQWGEEESRDILADCLSLQPEVQKVLRSVSIVFEPNNQFLLSRDYDHAIELELGACMVNVCPCRYSQF
ncbi:Ty3/gypsy retrotransposon protein [Cucumis melo var. makuwa]|uniref:Ty3/gypsy retrotransposon protein n=1 Tax=Cucumis melo var. makuwa TaxID=1194695 RepID=A0A5A7SPJ0_CUCMM|nr:Ty3/gypsy retrotransposon protein [Cucumis melo var. makuwa]TYK17131.1 Ty3/gypsy retrotransposon protein [Cucumis melo var. makuwa]